MTSGAKTVDITSNLIKKVTEHEDHSPILLIEFFLVNIVGTFGDKSDCLRKTLFSQNMTFGDLW